MTKQRLPRPRGAAIDLVHTWIRRQILTLKKEIAGLEKKGILLAYPHFKKGTHRMYLLEPTINGKRKYHYIGSKWKDIKLALDKIKRYHKLMVYNLMLGQVTMMLSENRRALDRLLGEFMMTHRAAEKAIIEGSKYEYKWAIENGVTPRRGSRPRPVTPDPDEEQTCRVCGCTEYTPCPGGCSWVEEDLCSNPDCVRQGNKAPGSGSRSRYPSERRKR